MSVGSNDEWSISSIELAFTTFTLDDLTGNSRFLAFGVWAIIVIGYIILHARVNQVSHFKWIFSRTPGVLAPNKVVFMFPITQSVSEHFHQFRKARRVTHRPR